MSQIDDQEKVRVEESGEARARSLYLDLMKRCLSNTIYRDQALTYADSLEGLKSGDRTLHEFDGRTREMGRDYPEHAHTMIGMRRLDNLQYCVERVIQEGVEGDLIETGVWRGGATIFMRAVLRAYSEQDRNVWVADSFEGLPEADPKAYPLDRIAPLHLLNDFLAVSADTVRENFARYGLLDDRVRFLEGFFRDTLPTAPIERLAVLRLDGDMFESTMDALTHLYPKLSPGGFVIVDDYHVMPPCRFAVERYRKEHGISSPIRDIDGSGVYFQRPA
ncbi:TylF/MycF family methyltransferase [Nocardiopsis dassonvillei]|uniref:TylF/MycF family methyltransferase n=1 Tax=Nocardiopsis dassonvillei TaxID=2014 RepID=UPI00200BDE7D|nr:TylF/MycF family methyltransferase [Nocardiopsis dassonvillei]MCK9874148.1 TylF/MycF family methyltransferase [Nocardiopsis dassonvillei]